MAFQLPLTLTKDRVFIDFRSTWGSSVFDQRL